MSGTVWSIAGMLAALIVGYSVGWQHGSDSAWQKAKAEIKDRTQVVRTPYPFAGACEAMLEAAWSIQPAPLPHD